jgi:hypothetical protein
MAQCIQSHVVCDASREAALKQLKPPVPEQYRLSNRHRRITAASNNHRQTCNRSKSLGSSSYRAAPSRPALAASSKHSRRSVTKLQKMISSRGCRCRRVLCLQPHLTSIPQPHAPTRSKRQQPPPALLTMPVSPPCVVHWYAECSFAPPQCRVAVASGRHHRSMQARLLLIPITKRGA